MTSKVNEKTEILTLSRSGTHTIIGMNNYVVDASNRDNLMESGPKGSPQIGEI